MIFNHPFATLSEEDEEKHASGGQTPLCAGASFKNLDRSSPRLRPYTQMG